MEDKLKQDIKAFVSEIFSQKEEQERISKTEAALEESARTIEELTKALDSKTNEVEELGQTVASLEEEMATVKEALKEAKDKAEEADKGKASVEDELAKAQASVEELSGRLADIEKNTVADARMKELETAGVLSKNPEAQRAKIIDMDDEAFTSYKEELASVKEAIMASLSDNQTTDPDDDGKSVDNNDTPDADLNGKSKASLNLESDSSDLATKYAELGKALAAKMVGDKSN